MCWPIELAATPASPGLHWWFRLICFPGTDSIVVCLITSVERDAPLLRVPLPVNDQTGLQQPSWVQIEKITAVSRNQIGRRIGVAGATAMLEVIRRLAVLLRIG